MYAAGQQCLSIRASSRKFRSSLGQCFFYREGVLNANQLTAPASDEFDLVRAWQQLAAKHAVMLNVCVAAALRRGVTDQHEANQLNLAVANLQPGFYLNGLGCVS